MLAQLIEEAYYIHEADGDAEKPKLSAIDKIKSVASAEWNAAKRDLANIYNNSQSRALAGGMLGALAGAYAVPEAWDMTHDFPFMPNNVAPVLGLGGATIGAELGLLGGYYAPNIVNGVRSGLNRLPKFGKGKGE